MIICGSHLGVILPLPPTRKHVAISGGIFDGYNWGLSATGIPWEEAKDFTIHLTVDRAATPNISNSDVKKPICMCVCSIC